MTGTITFPETLPLPGETVTCALLLRAVELRQSRHGAYVHTRAVTPAGPLEAMVFENVRRWPAVLCLPQVVVARLIATDRGYVLEAIDPEPEGDLDPWAALPRGPLEEHEAWEDLVARLDCLVTQENDRELLLNLLEETDFVTRFRRSPAALEVHHPWRGGLVEHVTEALIVAENLAVTYDADLSLVALGVWLHDVGKLWELDPVAGRYTRSGELIGHLVGGVNWLAARLSTINYPAARRDALLHILVAHHGSLDKGSPRPPMTREALIVHTVDRLDSEMFQFRREEADTPLGSFSARNPWIGRKVYRSV